MTAKPTEYLPGAGHAGGGSGVRAKGGFLQPGSVIGDGRYRLLAQFGEDRRANAQLWRARDGQLARDVALTVLLGSPADARAAGEARRTLERAMHAANFSSDSVARVLDVLTLGEGITPTEGILGMVIAEWTPGTDLIDLIVDGPVAPGTATALLEPLAGAVEQAHHAGLVLGVDHPQRLRLTPQGTLRLAFPGPLSGAMLRDDVRGLGALLYLLTTGRWPLAGGPEALPPAPSGPDGSIVAPRTLQPDIPLDLSQLAVRTLDDGVAGSIRTSAAVLQVLERVAAAEPETTVFRAVGGAGKGKGKDDNAVWITKKPIDDAAHKRRLATWVGVLVVATVAVFIWIVSQVLGFFSDSNATGGGPKVDTPTPPAKHSSAPPTAHPAQPAGAPIVPTDVSVFAPNGQPDHPAEVHRVIDHDPGTVWRTDEYKQQFPVFSPGVGIMATFDHPVTLSKVEIDSPSQGTQVQVRTASAPDVPIDQTQVIGNA
ncbi:MAG: protein kinase family protein, partial [Sciscionella sp.]|nr:protein kinase family protein [Sciscionella sp.]